MQIEIVIPPLRISSHLKNNGGVKEIGLPYSLFDQIH
jgi:hypothetical protein